jgi:DNA-binding MarR family transcriptional regulator
MRRIVRAHDLQSKALTKSAGLTAAQLVLMKGMAELGEVTSAALSAYADISPATVVTVLDNLEERGLIERYRSGSDRRIVHARLTSKGASRVSEAPAPLGETFMQRYLALSEGQRGQLAEAASWLADVMSRDAPQRPVKVAGPDDSSDR